LEASFQLTQEPGRISIWYLGSECPLCPFHNLSNDSQFMAMTWASRIGHLARHLSRRMLFNYEMGKTTSRSQQDHQRLRWKIFL